MFNVTEFNFFLITVNIKFINYRVPVKIKSYINVVRKEILFIVKTKASKIKINVSPSRKI